MVEEVNSQKPLIVCASCQGSGLVSDQICQTCSGHGLGLWLEGRFIYWDKTLNVFTIILNKIENILRNIINFFLVILSVVGIVCLAIYLYQAWQAGLGLWLAFNRPSYLLTLFWLSLLVDGYIYYRFEKQLTSYRPVINRSYHKELLPVNFTFTWENLNLLPKKNQIEASSSLNFEASQVLDKSFKLAEKFQHSEVNGLHLLIALISVNRIGNIFGRLGIGFKELKEKLTSALLQVAKQGSLRPVISVELKKIILLAYFNAWENRKKRIGPTELLVASVLEDNLAKEVLYSLKVDQDKLKNVVLWSRVQKQLWENWQHFKGRSRLKPHSKMNRAMTAIATPILDSYGQDLTLLAQSGYLEPCIDRQEEAAAIFRLIESGQKSVILVGNPGVGKTTIIEGLAQKTVLEEVPEVLHDKRLVSLSVARLVAGATPAEAQERLLMALQEMAISGNIILYIKDIHGMIGITSGGRESIDLAATLVSTLKQLHTFCLASATPQEYSRYIEPHGALGNFLNKVEILEPQENAAIQIIEAKTPLIEGKEGVFFSYEAVVEAVKLSTRYIHDRYLPQKAVLLLEEVASYVHKQRGTNALITGQDVAVLISEKTKIKVTEVTVEESNKLLRLEEIIHERLIGQEEAVKAVANALRRARAELRDVKRPIANFLFLGPTGVGKTELAKTIAEVYFGGEGQMQRLDMSEYQNQDSIHNLIGVAGINGEMTGGYLTEGVRKNPYNVVLLDEFEKAHPEILNLFLQVMDDGRLTDGLGRTIDFTNVILIATSNAGTQTIQDNIQQGLGLAEIKRILLEQELKKYFRPELINRFDSVVVFKPLTLPDVVSITKLLLKQIAKRLQGKGVALEFTDSAVQELAQYGFDPVYGARPLRRVLNERVDDVLANYLLGNKLARRDVVVLDAGGAVEIKKAQQL
ncbi:MAG: ATP-dependent Clp protease ATP-binding subunit [Candidatus Buchananbacteria bacterium]